MTNKITVSIVWVLNEDDNYWTPVYVTEDESDAEEYMFERSENYNCTYIATYAKVSSPRVSKREVLSDAD